MRHLVPYVFVGHFPTGWKCSECGLLFRIKAANLSEFSKTDPSQSIAAEFNLHNCQPRREQLGLSNQDQGDMPGELPQELSWSMTTRAAGFASDWRTHACHEITSWEQFQKKFCEAFGREMTPNEYHWFHSLWTNVNDGKQEKSRGAAA